MILGATMLVQGCFPSDRVRKKPETKEAEAPRAGDR